MLILYFYTTLVFRVSSDENNVMNPVVSTPQMILVTVCPVCEIIKKSCLVCNFRVGGKGGGGGGGGGGCGEVGVIICFFMDPNLSLPKKSSAFLLFLTLRKHKMNPDIYIFLVCQLWLLKMFTEVNSF